jgi:hypothetical protein
MSMQGGGNLQEHTATFQHKKASQLKISQRHNPAVFSLHKNLSLDHCHI